MKTKYSILNPTIPRQQSGVVLVISLIMLLALTLIGITSSSVTGLEEKMAANSKNKNLAFQAAEAALRAAETSLGANKPSFVNKGNRALTIANQGTGGGAGYYTLLLDNAVVTNGAQTKDPDPITPAQTPAFYSGYSATTCPKCVNWGSTQKDPVTNSPQNSIVYSGVDLKGIYNKPEYIIEEMVNKGNTAPSSAGGGGANLGGGSDAPSETASPGNTITFRITAHGWGNNTNAVVTIQSIVKVSYPN